MKTWLRLLALLPLLAGCASLAGNEMVGVDLTPVNYTGGYYSAYLVVNPETGKAGGGEGVNEYSAGGSMCCFTLPQTWRPGLQAEVRLRLPSKGKTYAERSVEPEEWVSRVVEIPPYVDGRPGTLWTLIYPDHQVEVVVSAYGPTSAKWPGRVKGWPVPSLEFRRKLWEEKVVEYQRRIRRFEQAAQDETNPVEATSFKEAAEEARQRIKQLGPRP